MNDSEEKAIWKILAELNLSIQELVGVAEASSIAMVKIYERVSALETRRDKNDAV